MKKGDKAPPFTLQNSEEKEISLDYLTEKEKALLLFFPLAFSKVCTEELCKVKDNMKMYNALNTNVAGISVDSFFTLKEFKKTYNLNFTLLSDFNKEVSYKYNSFYDDYFGMKGVAKRAAFIINKNQIIEYAEILDDSDQLPDFKKIQKALSQSA
jgi:glutaredoxin-dependent peroxiredoxin